MYLTVGDKKTTETVADSECEMERRTGKGGKCNRN